MEDHDPVSNSPGSADSALTAAVDEVMDVDSIKRSIGRVEMVGRLRVPAEVAYERLSSRFAPWGYTPLLRRRQNDDVVVALLGTLRSSATSESRPYLPAVLLFATLLSTLYVGAEGPLRTPLDLLSGWPFAASLLGILLAHETGHYLVGRRLGVPSSLPYFIPFPFSVLGTLGAVIRLKAQPKNRRHLLAVAIAGPLAGLFVAIPVLLIGLRLSHVEPVPQGEVFFQEGNSLLYLALKFLVFGRLLPGGGEDVFLHPVALAGWAGLLVTALNLLPAGQLDGGHIVNSLLGAQAKWLSYAVFVGLLALSIVWSGWLLWAALVLLFGQRRLEPLDDVTPLRRPERALAFALVIVFALVFTPIPLS